MKKSIAIIGEDEKCFIRFRAYLYESFGVGLMTDLNSDSRKIFKTIVKDYPINQDVIDTLANFKERNKRNK